MSKRSGKIARITDLLGPAEFRKITVSVLQSNPRQPRKSFDRDAISRLAGSIQEGGQIQPIMVVERQIGSRSIMYIAVGERRVRALRQLRWPTIQAMIRTFNGNDDEFNRLMRWYGVVENVDREDLTPIEQAHAFAELMETEGLSQQEVAEIFHVQPILVSVYLGLLALDDELQNAVARKLADPSIVVSAVRAYDASGRVQRKMARALTKGQHKTATEQRRLVENIVADEDLYKHGSGESSSRVVAIRRIRRLFKALEDTRDGVLEVTTASDGVVRDAFAKMKRGDRMMFDNILDEYEAAFQLLRQAIKELRG